MRLYAKLILLTLLTVRIHTLLVYGNISEFWFDMRCAWAAETLDTRLTMSLVKEAEEQWLADIAKRSEEVEVAPERELQRPAAMREASEIAQR